MPGNELLRRLDHLVIVLDDNAKPREDVHVALLKHAITVLAIDSKVATLTVESRVTETESRLLREAAAALSEETNVCRQIRYRFLDTVVRDHLQVKY